MQFVRESRHRELHALQGDLLADNQKDWSDHLSNVAFVLMHPHMKQ